MCRRLGISSKDLINLFIDRLSIDKITKIRNLKSIKLNEESLEEPVSFQEGVYGEALQQMNFDEFSPLIKTKPQGLVPY